MFSERNEREVIQMKYIATYAPVAEPTAAMTAFDTFDTLQEAVAAIKDTEAANGYKLVKTERTLCTLHLYFNDYDPDFGWGYSYYEVTTDTETAL